MTASKTGFKSHGSEDGGSGSERADGRPGWLFFSNHGYVLLCIARDPRMRISEISDRVGIGERATQKIVADLVADGYISRTKEGRRNRYEVNPNAPLRHPLFAGVRMALILNAFRDGDNRPS
jgi:hypothetical protein